MDDYEKYFNYPGAQLTHFYIYSIIAAVIAFYLVIKSDSKYKIELFFISLFLLTGNINELLTIKIPGFSLFEIQPTRFIFFLLVFFIARNILFSKGRYTLSLHGKVPWFELALIAYVICMTISLIVNVTAIGIAVALKEILGALTALVLFIALQLMADKPSYDLIGKSIIVAAVISSIVSLIQFTLDPFFLRIGDDRLAFAGFLRSNGIFSTEYYNSYFLITAIAWTLVTIKNSSYKFLLVVLFSIGVLSSFQRMSWLILAMVIITYFVYIRKTAIEKMVLAVLASLTVVMAISIFCYQDIMNSSLVKERLSESVDGRKGYYAMVLDNIGKKPLFGYGDINNEVYYVNMLRITGERERASGKEGDLHSGYFSALFLYGIPAFICFVSFVVLSVHYYARSYKENLYFAIPLIVSIIYMIGNLTNTFLFLKYISVIYAIHIGIGMGMKQLRNRMTLQN